MPGSVWRLQELFPDPKTRLQNINLGNLVEETKSRETYEMNIESIESSPQSNSSRLGLKVHLARKK